MLSEIRQDVRRACLANQRRIGAVALVTELMNPGTQAILLYRIGHGIHHLPVPGLRHLLKLLYFPIHYAYRVIVGIQIPVSADIGPGFVIHTWGGGIFVPRCRIGSNVTIVGGGVLMDYYTRGIGDDVFIGAGAKLIGKIRIGNRVRIGPNAVVLADVPDDCRVIAHPGRIVGPFPPGQGVEGRQRVHENPEPRSPGQTNPVAR